VSVACHMTDDVCPMSGRARHIVPVKNPDSVAKSSRFVCFASRL